MARHFRFSLLLTVIFLLCALASAHAQTASTQARDGMSITIGQSSVALNGPWKFTIGDSPLDSTTGKPLWASPGFDDSQWETVDLTPSAGTAHPLSGQKGFVPGWTAKGKSVSN